MENLHPFVQKLKTFLEKKGVAYKYWEHKAVKTSEEAQKLRPDYRLSQGAKALVMQLKMSDGSRQFIQCIVPGDTKIDNKKLEAFTLAKGSRFATTDEAIAITDGIEFGGIPPFGNLFVQPISIIVDPSLLMHNEIIFSCGDRRVSMAMKANDWRAVVGPAVADIIV